MRWLQYLLLSPSNLGLKENAASQQARPQLTLVISPKKLAAVLVLVVLGLTVAHVTIQYLKFFQDHGTLLGLSRQLDLDNENNIPTWYSSLALLFSAILLSVIGLANRRGGNPYTFHWLGLAAIFFCLSLDEAASFHETMYLVSTKSWLKTIGYFHGLLRYSWVVSGIMFALIITTVYLRFLAALPAKIRALFLIAGTMYVGGALGIEMLGARYAYFYGENNFTYTMFVACEESFEMLGVVVFIYALLSHLGSSLSNLQIMVNNDISTHIPAIAVEIKRPGLPAQTEAAPALGTSQISARLTKSR